MNSQTTLSFQPFSKPQRTFGKNLLNCPIPSENLLKPTFKNSKSHDEFYENPLDFSFQDQNPLQSYGDPQALNYYIDEIFSYIHAKNCDSINPNYMKEVQKDLNEKMRAILIDWLVSVHIKFSLSPPTLFLTVNIIDRYLQRTSIPRQKLQLVGISSLLIASKMEEIYYPEILDLVTICDCSYGKKEIIEMEANVVSKLSFDFSYSSPLIFLEYYAKFEQFNEKMRLFCQYILELCLTEYHMLKFNGSLLAIASVYLVNTMWKNSICSEDLIRKTCFEGEQIKNVANDMFFMLKNQEKTRLKAVKTKYSGENYQRISKTKIESGFK